MIERRRTVHGGTDSALCVEVTAWQRDGVSIAPVLGYVAGPDRGIHANIGGAHGVGVYIRNPLALHVRDFEPGVGTIEQARAAAFEWADALADHLGCEVVSSLLRLPVPEAPEYDALTLCDAAASLWEAALDLREHASGDPKSAHDKLAVRFAAQWEREGTSSTRLQICGFAVECEAAWRALSEDEQESVAPFDWEFVPAWLHAKLESIL